MSKKVLFVLIMMLFIIPCAFSASLFRSSENFKKDIIAPDFMLKDIQGKTVRLSSFRGNPVVLFFGTTWCPACRAEIPAFKSTYEKHARRGLKFFYIDINESTDRVSYFAGQNAFPYPVLVDSDGSVANRYRIIGVPTIVLVNKDGNIAGVAHRTSDLHIDELLAALK